MSNVHTQNSLRPWYQPGGAGPLNPIFYGGQNGEILVIGDTTIPEVGGRSRINIQDPAEYGSFIQAGEEISPPDFINGSVMFRRRHGKGIPRHLYDPGCLFTFYEASGDKCARPEIFDLGWVDYLGIKGGARRNDATKVGGAFDGSSPLDDTVNFVYDRDYLVGQISFGLKDGTAAPREVVGVVYGARLRCGDCGPNDDGTKLGYAAVINDSGVTAPEIAYSLDGGNSWTAAAITGSINTDVPSAIAIAGQYLLVAYKGAADAGYFVATIDDVTGVPGSFTKVTTGFTAANGPLDIWVASPREVWICGENGALLFTDNVLQGVTAVTSGTSEDLFRIHGNGSTIVVGGATDTVIYSLNGGETFTAVTNSPGGDDINAVCVVSRFSWWVGDAAGAVSYTNTQGRSAWTAITLPAAVSAGIKDIVFPTPECGFIAGTNSTPRAVLFATQNGGRTWAEGNNTRRLGTLGDYDRINRIAFPELGNSLKSGIMANNLLLGGLSDDGTDGMIVVGAAAVDG